jgi:hypothetical protein
MSFIEKQLRTETEIINYLNDQLPGLIEGLRILDVEQYPNVDMEYRPDLIARVKVGRVTRTLVIVVRSKGEPRLAKMSIATLKGYGKTFPRDYPVFASVFVSERTRQICRKEGVGYIDLVGNIYLRFGSVLIDRVSPGSWQRERRGAKQLFAPKATRVVRHLLVHKDEHARISDLADSCDMTPGGVHWVVSLLQDKGFVERDDKKRVVLTRPGDLLDAWAEAWSMDRNRRRIFFSLERTPGSLMRSVADAALGTGTVHAFTLLAGASKVAPHVRFNDVWVYIAEEEGAWGRDLDLQPVDGGGNLVMLEPYDKGVFMDLQVVDGMRVVSNVQLYVDLYNHPGRGREQAEFLRERVLGY